MSPALRERLIAVLEGVLWPRTECIECDEAAPIALSKRDTELFDNVMQSDCRPNATLQQLGERYRKAKANGTIQVR